MHVLEAGFEIKDRPGVLLLHGLPRLRPRASDVQAHVDNLEAYSIPLETGLLIPSENVNYGSADCTAPAEPHEQRDAFPSDGVRCVKFSIAVWLEIGLGHARIRIKCPRRRTPLRRPGSEISSIPMSWMRL
jgi:hypothetical protein